jgi:putative addiction module component (TIGR02574 family)
MTAAFDPALRALSVAERIQLVEDLWDSIASDSEQRLLPTAAQLAAAEQRWQEHEADPATAVSWASLRAEMAPEADH